MPFPVDQKFVDQTEQKLGATLPQSYSAAMREKNGGSIRTSSDEWQLYPIFDSSDKQRLKRTCNDVIRETHSAATWAGFPDNAVAIGSNGGGDQLIFLRHGDRLRPEVLWWDHETGAVKRIAADFGELTRSD